MIRETERFGGSPWNGIDAEKADGDVAVVGRGSLRSNVEECAGFSQWKIRRKIDPQAWRRRLAAQDRGRHQAGYEDQWN